MILYVKLQKLLLWVVFVGLLLLVFLILMIVKCDSLNHGDWYKDKYKDALANNSVNYKEKPDVGTFMREWLSLYDSKSGERGIYNGLASKYHVNELNTREKDKMAHTFNEEWRETISAQILAAKSFYDPENSATCPKLSSDSNDTMQSLKDKVRIATILGTFPIHPHQFQIPLKRVAKKL